MTKQRRRLCFEAAGERRQCALNVKKHLSIRMDGELHDKFQYVAAYEGRSMSGQVLYLLRKCVQEHEKEYGKITKEDLEDPSVQST